MSITTSKFEASYIVYSGSNGIYYAKNGMTGKIDYSGSSATYVINSTINNLSTPSSSTVSARDWQEGVVLNGYFVITGSIILPSHTYLKINGEIYLANTSNCHMIVNKNRTSWDVGITIDGGILNGNRDNQTSGSGISLRNATSPSLYRGWNTIKNMYIEKIDDHGINLDNTSGWSYNWLENLFIERCDLEAFFSTGCDDMHLSNIHLGSDSSRYAAVFQSESVIIANGLYINGPVYMGAVVHSFFTDFFFDTRAAATGLDLRSVYCTKFSQGEIHVFGDNGNITNAGIYLQTSGSACTDNSFNQIRVGRSLYQTADSNVFAVGIAEANTSQLRNIFMACDTRDCSTIGLQTSGSTSHVAHSWNLTTWVDYT